MPCLLLIFTQATTILPHSMSTMQLSALPDAVRIPDKVLHVDQAFQNAPTGEVSKQAGLSLTCAPNMKDGLICS